MISEELMELGISKATPKRMKQFRELFYAPKESELPKFHDPSLKLFTPTTFEDYIGQEHAKGLVYIMMQAAKLEQRPFPNLMISGTAGLGKTSLARIILKDEEYSFTDGNSLNISIANLKGYVIVDEIHNTRSDVCDAINLLIDDGSVRIMGCTTNPGMLPHPFRTRFRNVHLTPYSIEDLVQIQQKVLERRGDLVIPYRFLADIASRGRYTPRVTLQYLSFVMDMMMVTGQHTLTQELLDEAFDSIGVDQYGLLEIDRKYMASFPDNGKPVGLQYLSAVLSCDKETIEQDIEPYLLSLKLIDRTSKGRVKINDDYADRLAIQDMFGGL